VSRERIFKILLGALIALLLLLLFRFKPSVVGPKNLEKPKVKEGSAVLSGKNFSYEVRDKNILKYTLYADEVLERNEQQEKDLLNPVVLIPNKEGKTDKIFAKKGIFSPNKSELRLFDEAKIVTSDDLKIKSSAFRVTPFNEVVSESKADFEKDKLKGSGDILRYDREKRIAYLEGNVHIKSDSDNLSFDASRMTIDLESHNGKIEGPINGKKDDILVSSPNGEVILDDKNNIDSIILQEPSNGETENFTFSSRNIKFDFKNSKVDHFTLIDNVIIVQKAEPKSKLKTETLIFEKGKDLLWHFTAPSKMFFERVDEKLECSKGTGVINKGEITADLEGPVRGWDEKMEISSARGKLNNDSFEFIGNALTSSSEGNIRAERIISFKSGEKEARSNVKGTMLRKNESKILFSSEKARISPNVYPINLLENVTVESDNFNLKGSDFTFLSSKTFKGCNGVLAYFQGTKGSITGYGKEADYNEDEQYCVFKGDPYTIDDSGKLSAKDKITAFFNSDRKIKMILAEVEAKYESENQSAFGDTIKYYPEAKKGEVSSEKGIAEVIEKEPFRRSVGRKIVFAEKEVEIKGAENKTNRGKMEGLEVKEKH